MVKYRHNNQSSKFQLLNSVSTEGVAAFFETLPLHLRNKKSERDDDFKIGRKSAGLNKSCESKVCD